MTQTNKPPESREIYRLEANTPLWLAIKDNPEALRQLREDMLQTLLTEREEMKEKVIKHKSDMKKIHFCAENDGECNCECYLEAIDAVLKLLE